VVKRKRYRWDGFTELNPDGTPFSSGFFNEIQIVSVPEPSTVVLLAMGLISLALRARRTRP
jgi:hypothetical protein